MFHLKLILIVVKVGKRGKLMRKILSIIFFLAFSLLTILPSQAEDVFYNTQSKKYHNFYCRYITKCTVNCIKITKKEAIQRGGVPCKVCGG